MPIPLEVEEAGQFAEVDINQPDSVSPAEAETERVYKHTLEDGREFSGTREQAMELCPVLGKMSPENVQATLDDADLAQRIAARGRANRLAQEQEAQHNSKQDENVVIKRADQKEDNAEQQAKSSIIIKTPSIKEEVFQPDQLGADAFYQHKLAVRREDPEETAAVAIEEATSAAIIETSRQNLPRQDAPQDAPRGSVEQERAPNPPLLAKLIPERLARTRTLPSALRIANIGTPVKILHKAPKDRTDEIVDTRVPVSTKANGRIDLSLIAPVAPEVITSGSNGTAATETDTKLTGAGHGFEEFAKAEGIAPYHDPIDDLKLIPEDVSDLLVVNEAENSATSDGGENVLPEGVVLDGSIAVDPEIIQSIDIDEETIEIYYQLLALDENIVDVADEPTGLERALLISDGLETVDVDVAKDYFESQPQPKEAVNLETIILCAADQTLEETFTQLASYLTETADAGNDETLFEVTAEGMVVRELLRDILEKTEPLRITPEITQKLLVLLRAVGYEDPQEALLKFVADHSPEFLLLTVRYLYQLANEDTQPETQFIKIPALSAVGDDDPIPVRLGRAIINLLKLRLEAPLTITTL
jgi:hypothetical protein